MFPRFALRHLSRHRDPSWNPDPVAAVRAIDGPSVPHESSTIRSATDPPRFRGILHRDSRRDSSVDDFREGKVVAGSSVEGAAEILWQRKGKVASRGKFCRWEEAAGKERRLFFSCFEKFFFFFLNNVSFVKKI